MATMDLTDEELVIRLTRGENIAALHGDGRVPLSAIGEVELVTDAVTAARGSPLTRPGDSGAAYGELLVSTDDAQGVAERDSRSCRPPGRRSAYLRAAVISGVPSASPADGTLLMPSLNKWRTQRAPITVPAKINIPLSPTRYSLTTTGSAVRVNAAMLPQTALCVACAMEAGQRLPV